MEKKLTGRGGPGRGQGRPRKAVSEAMVPVMIKMKSEQKEKLARLGGALGGAHWVRQKIDKAREPSE